MKFAIVDPIVFGCEGVKNSGNKTDLCGVCGGDNSTCTDCAGKIRPGFVNNRSCGKLLCTIAARCIVHRRIFDLCCETCKGVLVICEVRRVESIESEKNFNRKMKKMCVVFVEVIIQNVQIVKETSILTLSSMDHVINL